MDEGNEERRQKWEGGEREREREGEGGNVISMQQ